MYNDNGQNYSNNMVPEQFAVMANSLYHSLKGQYFVGYADDMFFEKTRNAWAALYNPPDSGVNLFVNVWSVINLYEPPIRMQIWLNSSLPGNYAPSLFITPANTAIYPLPVPKVKLMQASNVEGNPTGGVKAFARRTIPNETIAVDEEGKFIIPPGGNFAIFLSNPEGQSVTAQTRIGYGWWEESI